MPDDPLLDYLERTFAEAYRKEVDAEENVWRTLPFFAATLALELAALAQVRDWVAGTRGWVLAAGEAMLAVAGLMTMAAIAALAMSVRSADFRRVAPEVGLLDFVVTGAGATSNLDGDAERDAGPRVLLKVRGQLARQYADAVNHNQAIIENRLKWRTRAGLATLTSVLSVLGLVGLAVLSNIHVHG